MRKASGNPPKRPYARSFGLTTALPTSWKHGTKTLTGNYVFCGIAFKEDAGIQDEEREYEEERKRRREASIYIPSSSSEVYSK